MIKIQFTLTDCKFSEDEILDRVEKDWGIRRPNRITKTTFSFYDADNLKYAMAEITSPKEYAGKIVGYSGVGEYEDLLVDAGTFVIGGNFSKRNDLPDFRGNQVGFRVRGVRDNYSESLSDSRDVPFLIIVIAGPNNYTKSLESKGYEVNSNGIPEWAKRRVKGKYYVVYNPIANAMKKAWEILKNKKPNLDRQIYYDLKKLFKDINLLRDSNSRQRAVQQGSIEFHIILREIKRKYPDITPDRLRDYLDKFEYYGPVDTRDGRRDVYFNMTR